MINNDNIFTALVGKHLTEVQYDERYSKAHDEMENIGLAIRCCNSLDEVNKLLIEYDKKINILRNLTASYVYLGALNDVRFYECITEELQEQYADRNRLNGIQHSIDIFFTPMPTKTIQKASL